MPHSCASIRNNVTHKFKYNNVPVWSVIIMCFFFVVSECVFFVFFIFPFSTHHHCHTDNVQFFRLLLAPLRLENHPGLTIEMILILAIIVSPPTWTLLNNDETATEPIRIFNSKKYLRNTKWFSHDYILLIASDLSLYLSKQMMKNDVHLEVDFVDTNYYEH